LLTLGTVLETVGLVSLVCLLPVSDESKWRIRIGLGVGFVVVGYLLANRSNPKNKHSPPTAITPNTHSQDSCNRSDSIGKKFCHIPNIPSKPLISSNTPITHRIPLIRPPSRLRRLGISFPLCHQLNRRIVRVSTIMGNGLARYVCDCYALMHGNERHLLRRRYFRGARRTRL
jgi:hypothetical protein